MPGDPSIDAVRAAQAAFRDGEIARYAAVLDWVADHSLTGGSTVIGRDSEATVFDAGGRPRRLGGAGCPSVGEYELWALGAALGVSSATVLTQASAYAEIAHRLPRLHARVIAGEATLWRACRIAQGTIDLPASGAQWVDDSLAWCAERVSWAVLARLVEAARAEYDPPAAAAAADARHVEIHLHHPGHELDGVVEVHGLLDYTDGLDLDTALHHRADQLRRLGATETPEVLRSVALGDLARQQLALDLDTDESPTPSPAGRAVTIHAHLDDSDVARLDHPDGRLAMIEQVKAWCGTSTRVTVRPIVDLRIPIDTSTYVIPDLIREHVELRHPVCAFPHCGRRATSCDLDHRRAWPQGPTSTENLAPLCRRHHLLKTHGGWRYCYVPPDSDEVDLETDLFDDTTPAHWLWFSPAGHTYVTPA